MILGISTTMRAVMEDDRRRFLPKEACGLLVQTPIGVAFLGCDNTAEEAHENFQIEPADVRHANAIGKITGVWHSHPTKSSDPSESDIMLMRLTPQWYHIITGVDGTAVWSHDGKRLVRLASYPAIAGQ